MTVLDPAFDRRGRTAAIASLLRAAPGGPPRRVLELVDATPALAEAMPETRVLAGAVDGPWERPAGVAIVVDARRGLPFGDDAFDAAVVVDVAGWLGSPARPPLLREVRRCTRGLMVVTAPLATPAAVLARTAVGAAARRLGRGVEPPPGLERAEMAALLAQLGGAARETALAALATWTPSALLALLAGPAAAALDALPDAAVTADAGVAWRGLWVHARDAAALPAMPDVPDVTDGLPAAALDALAAAAASARGAAAGTPDDPAERLAALRRRLDRLQDAHDALDARALRLQRERDAAVARLNDVAWRLARLGPVDRALDTVLPVARRLLAPLRARPAAPALAPGDPPPAERGAAPASAAVDVVVVTGTGADDDGAALAATQASLDAQTARPSAIRVVAGWDGTATGAAAHVAVLLAGERLAPDALSTVAEALRAQPEATLVYSDEDVERADGVREPPCRKPGWDPELARAANYVGGLAVLRRDLLAAVPAGATPAEGLYACTLAAAERDEALVVHLPLVLLHGTRATAACRRLDVAAEAPRRLLQTHLARIGDPGMPEPAGPGFAIRRPVTPDTAVTIVVPFRDRPALLEACVGSIRRCAATLPWELLLVDNRSTEPATAALLARLRAEEPSRIRVLPYRAAFNFAAINDAAVAEARGDVVVLLNNDTEIVTPGWLEILAGLACRPDVGAVGVQLRFPDGRLQHCGVGLGLGTWPGRPYGVAAHLLSGRPVEDAPALLWAYDRRCSAVTAACLAVRRDRWLAVGGMDPRLATDFNDVDLCLKLAARGLHTLYTPHVVVVHHESASRTGRPLDPREVECMFARWGDRLGDDRYVPGGVA